LNHVRGRGCRKAPCNFKHVCIICNSSSHGAFQKETVNGQIQYKCKLHLGLLKDLLELRRQYKFHGRDETAAALAIECGITTRLFTSVAIPLIVKLKRGIPDIVDTPTLRSLGIDVAALGVGAAFEDRKKSAAAAAHRTKPTTKPNTRPPSCDRAATSTSTMTAAAGGAATAVKLAAEDQTKVVLEPRQCTPPPTCLPASPSPSPTPVSLVSRLPRWISVWQ
jgi:hypothetical protein